MITRQGFILAILIMLMVLIAVSLGNWSEQINPNGITPHPAADGQAPIEPIQPRDAFSFGVSMGLLATALGYCCIAFGLLITARSKGEKASRFTFWIAGLAGLGFALSYLIDDYFY